MSLLISGGAPSRRSAAKIYAYGLRALSSNSSSGVLQRGDDGQHRQKKQALGHQWVAGACAGIAHGARPAGLHGRSGWLESHLTKV